MKRSKSASPVLTIAEKCKSILASNWEGKLTTIKADAKGRETFIARRLKKGKPYVWVPENDPCNVNPVIDERGLLAVTSPFPGPLAQILESMKRSPSRIALIGDVVPVTEEKVQSAVESLEEAILSEQKAVSESTYAVSGLLSSANLKSTSRIENLKELLDGTRSYSIYKFDIRSCTFVDGHGGAKEIDLENI
ncbi:hypothetical protein MLD38_009768 [Melastoma candidum]|uniref:Uncharacterized protein n=1 Tax=Melastoma candidum TaxID=119954 RepID=A0ACB9S747_9MYRT|nr:hypothetical protein MLD38_009768 [Melastoma candidum]